MSAKPGDFFLGIIDFFAVLLPGAAATHAAWFALDHGAHDQFALLGLDGIGGTTRWVVYLFSAYFSGQLIFLFGSALDPFYDKWRRLKHPEDEDAAFHAAEDLRKTLSGKYKVDKRFSTFKWAKAYVKLRASEARKEIEGHEAASKFFRSFTVLFGAGGVIALVPYLFQSANAELWMPAVALGLAVACFLGFCDQRWKSTELAYAYAILVHQWSSESKRASGAEAGKPDADGEE